MDKQNPSNFIPLNFGQKVLPIRSKVEALLKTISGCVPGSRRKCYFHDTWKGVLMIVKNHRGAHSWDLFLEDDLIEGGFSSAELAAERAFQGDFDDEQQGRKVKGLHIPYDLLSWSECES
ncbi:MAG TPA: hypothetical protein VFT34_01180 [Verrucomicrobiae bacterium]|nr:hypothetical protein [Verrucomicrobiae bacterium]